MAESHSDRSAKEVPPFDWKTHEKDKRPLIVKEFRDSHLAGVNLSVLVAPPAFSLDQLTDAPNERVDCERQESIDLISRVAASLCRAPDARWEPDTPPPEELSGPAREITFAICVQSRSGNYRSIVINDDDEIDDSAKVFIKFSGRPRDMNFRGGTRAEIRGYFATAKRNAALDRQRRSKRRNTEPPIVDPPYPGPFGYEGLREQEQAVWRHTFPIEAPQAFPDWISPAILHDFATLAGSIDDANDAIVHYGMLWEVTNRMPGLGDPERLHMLLAIRVAQANNRRSPSLEELANQSKLQVNTIQQQCSRLRRRLADAVRMEAARSRWTLRSESAVLFYLDYCFRLRSASKAAE